MTATPKPAGENWTPEQRAGQQRLNEALDAARHAPIQGHEVPEQARRSGQMDD